MGDRALINASYGGRQSGLDGEAIMASFGGGGIGNTPTPTPSVSRLATSGTADPADTAAIGSGNTLVQYRTRHVVMEDTPSLAFDEGLFRVNGGTYADNAIPLPAGAVLSAALETQTIAGASSVANQRFKWAGADTYTATGNETNWISTDVLPASAFGLSKFTKGDVLWIRRAILFPTANPSWLANDGSDATSPASFEGVRGAADNSFNQVNGTGAFSGTAGTALANSRFLRPLCVHGPHSGVAVKGMGDSILGGKGGNRNGDGSASNATGGAFARAFYLANKALQKSGRDGNRIANFTTTLASVRLAQIAAGRYTHVFSNAGTNDLSANGVTATITALDNFLSLLQTTYSGIKVVFAHTLARTSSSTDSWATSTLTSQTVQNKNGANQFGPNPDYGSGTDVLVPFAAALASRVTSGALAGVVDPRSFWADATFPYLIRSNGTANYATTDGAHPTAALQEIIGQGIVAEVQAKVV